MSEYADKLQTAFNEFSRKYHKNAEELTHAYEDSYVFLTEAFEKCKGDIYTTSDQRILPEDINPIDLVGKVVTMDDLAQAHEDSLEGELDEQAADYFEVVNILAANPPESFDFKDEKLDDLKGSFKEALMLAKDHMDAHFCYRPLKGPIFGAYYDAENMTRDLINTL